jgi:hypothetical protein
MRFRTISAATLLVVFIVASACTPEEPHSGSGDAGADAQTDTQDDATSTGTCSASGELLYFHDDERRSTMIGDVTGDGVAETATLQQDGDADILSLGTDAGIVMGNNGFLVNVMSEDVNADGQLDLLIAQPWKSEAAIFFGPIRETVTWDAADIVFAAPTHGGLENLFGSGLVAGHLNDDASVDLLITAPAEGEEGCLGQEPPRVYYGPLQSGRYDREDADLELQAPQRECIGLRARCASNGFELLGQRGNTCVSYPVPLDDGTSAEACE